MITYMDNKLDKFLSYLNTPLSKETIKIIYEANNVMFDKCELYSDFVSSLLLLVHDTYLGDDITPSNERINHFKWCWDKNIDNFKLEGVLFESGELFEYFLEFLLQVFYFSDKTNQEENLKLWNELFRYTRNRTQSDIDTFLEVYKLFDISIKLKKKT